MNKDNDKLQKGFDEINDKETLPPFVWDNIVRQLAQEDSDLLKTGFEKYYENETPPSVLRENIQKKLIINSIDNSDDAFSSDNNNSSASKNIGLLTTKNHEENWKKRLKKIVILILLLLFVRTCLPETCVPETAMGRSNFLASEKQLIDDSELHSSKAKEAIVVQDVLKPIRTTIIPTTKFSAIRSIEKTNAIQNLSINQATIISNHQGKQNLGTTDFPPSSILWKSSVVEEINMSIDNKSIEKVKNSPIEPLNVSGLNIDSVILPLAETLPLHLEKKTKNTFKTFPKVELGLIGKLGTSILLGNKTSEGFRHQSLQETELRLSGSMGLIAGLKLSHSDAIIVQATPYSIVSQSFAAFSTEGKHYNQTINLSYFDFSLGYEKDWFVYNIANSNNTSLFTRFDINLSYLLLEQTNVNECITTSQLFKKWSLAVGLALGNRHHLNRFVLDYGIWTEFGLNDINNDFLLENQPTNLLRLGGFVSIKYKL